MIYSAFGLGIETRQPIARLAGARFAAGADIRVEFQARPAWYSSSLPAAVRYTSAYRDAAGAPMLVAYELPDQWVRLVYVDGTDFLIDRSGSQIWITWPEPLTREDACSYLLGPVVGFVLRLRGLVCLHASAVSINGVAIAMLGASGAGKSTTAAAFAAQGSGVLSDDVVALTETADGFLARSGYPRVRLWPSSLAALTALHPTAPTLPPDWGLRRFHLDLSGAGYVFEQQALPLAAIYVLDPRSDAPHAPWSAELSAREAVLALVEHSFATGLLDREMRAHEFDVLTRLVSRVHLRRVTPHRDIERLPALCELIRQDFLASTRTVPELTATSVD